MPTDAFDGLWRNLEEAMQLEDVESGLEHSAKNVYTEYHDAKRDEWQTQILPVLREMPLAELVSNCSERISRRALIDLRAGKSHPQPINRVFLSQIAKRRLTLG